MIRQAVPSSNPVIQKIVDDLFAEDRRSQQADRRAVNRVLFCRPVQIRARDWKHTISGITNNLSAIGVGIITLEAIPEFSSAKIDIFSETVRQSTILSELRWCKPFGNGWFVSGWKFVQVVRSDV